MTFFKAVFSILSIFCLTLTYPPFLFFHIYCFLPLAVSDALISLASSQVSISISTLLILPFLSSIISSHFPVLTNEVFSKPSSRALTSSHSIFLKRRADIFLTPGLFDYHKTNISALVSGILNTIVWFPQGVQSSKYNLCLN